MDAERSKSIVQQYFNSPSRSQTRTKDSVIRWEPVDAENPLDSAPSGHSPEHIALVHKRPVYISHPKVKESQPNLDENADVDDSSPGIFRPGYLEYHFDPSKKLFKQFWKLLWTVLLSLTASNIVFWFPNIFLVNMNLTSMFQNVVGAGIIAVATAFEQVKYQYLQTYFMYGAIKSGFCSVFTSFGNLIEDTSRLLYYDSWWLSPLNLFITLALAFLIYQFGRLVALKWKAGASFSLALMKMENENMRMAYELDIEIERNNNIQQSDSSDLPSDPLLQDSEKKEFYSALSNTSLSRLRDHVNYQKTKKAKHKSPYLQKRHVFILIGLLLYNVLSLLLVLLLDAPSPSDLPWVMNMDKYSRLVSYFSSIIWSVSGALVGTYAGSWARVLKSVQWGTFRVNMVSCILIAAAHGMLFFRRYVPGGQFNEFPIVIERFIADFCGSESGFSTVIDETTCLHNSLTVPKKVVLRNLFLNLFVGLLVYLFLIYIVLVLVLR